ncbi:hypothetical protein SAMN02927921_00351 [Sinomicrobium oceani]|uniref:Uncharacterized protein n=1 Tax=Sinomicrobium oceani TaxID=1150368 RepID=A0A1K1M3K3_9FLAO|nr:DUF6702 family protein [Sinomicrobium oceani]SFW17688.1 hypothetical protein SAMN02927921_00351 [Sinomicrobium oceani]
MHKFLKISILLLLLPLTGFTAIHKFYVSTTDINYDRESRAIQIVSRVFADDLEKTIDNRYEIKSGLISEHELPDADTYLENYYASKLLITVNGRKVTLRYLGKEYKDDMVVSYLEAVDVPLPTSLKTENKLLYETYPEQQNIVHIRSGDTRKSFLLQKDEDQCVLKFDK